MCETKYWNNLSTKVIDNIGVRITAMRSDNEIFTEFVKFPVNLQRQKAIDLVETAINSLESYRNCDCKSGRTCNKHLKFYEEGSKI